jgi:acyl transferase domain-containing protein
VSKFNGIEVSVAAMNSKGSVTLSGDRPVLESIKEVLDKEGVFARFLNVDVPFHNPRLDPIGRKLAHILKVNQIYLHVL